MSGLYGGRWRAGLIKLCGPKCSDTNCNTPGKSPHADGPRWQLRAEARYLNSTASLLNAQHMLIGAHWQAGGNVGLAIPPGLCVLDIDANQSAVAIAYELFGGHPIQITANGVHVWGGLQGETKVYGSHYGNLPVTIRHAGNMVVVAPSVHVQGAAYEWHEELPESPEAVPQFDLPQFRREVRRKGAAGPVMMKRGGSSEGDWRKRISEEWIREIEDPSVTFAAGQRHECLLFAAWHLVCWGAPQEEIEEILHNLVEYRFVAGGRFERDKIIEREIADVIRSSFARNLQWTESRSG